MSASSDLDVLWNPIKVGPIELPNRVIVSAHTVAFFDEPIVGDRFIDYYEERARGGVGLLVTGAEGVHPHGWRPPHYQAWREDAAPRYRRLADAVHKHGSKIFTQLWHSGLQTTGTMVLENQHPVLGPSAVPSAAFGKIAKAMEQEDIETVIDSFGRAAELARDAGIDGVEVGGAHGYLISSFMSKVYNRREDRYGGSVANRCRLAIEVGEEIRRRVGADFPVTFRMVFQEFIGEGGFEPDYCKELLAEIHAAGVYDSFSISGGSYHQPWAMVLPTVAGLGTPYIEHAAMAKAVVGGDVPIAAAAGIRTVGQAARVIAAGDADLIAMTRAHIADPEVLRKAREGRAAEARRCVGFNQGCIHRQALGGMISCTVNPVVGREGAWGIDKRGTASSPRHLLVVGGGPAGMKLAETAAERGHRVTLVEREERLGGQLAFAGRLPFREAWLDYVEDLGSSIERLGVEVSLGDEADVDRIHAIGADLNVVATGAAYDKTGFSVYRADRTAIPGAAENVLDPIEVLADPDRCGRRVVIVDDIGDHAALGVAELLGNAGREVHLVTMAPFVGHYVAQSFHAPGIYYPRLAAAGVELVPSTTVVEVTPDKVAVMEVWSGKAREIDADTVVVNMLRESRQRLYLELRDAGLPARRIGDAVAPRQVDEAVYEGMELGLGFESFLASIAPTATVGD